MPWGTASWRTPAPMRNAAVPASTAAPGVAAEPATTNTVPRPRLSVPPHGSGQARRSSAVSNCSSTRGNRALRCAGHGNVLVDHRRGPADLLELRVPFGVGHVAGQRAVREVTPERQDGLLVEVLQQVAHDQD